MRLQRLTKKARFERQFDKWRRQAIRDRSTRTTTENIWYQTGFAQGVVSLEARLKAMLLAAEFKPKTMDEFLAACTRLEEWLFSEDLHRWDD